MDPYQNFFSNSPNFPPSEDYFPNLENIQNSEEFVQFTTPQHHQNFEKIPQISNTSSGPQNWTEQEDISLMYSWCRVSENPIVGINQKGDALWQRVSELYQQARANHQNPSVERSVESLRNRYKRLNTNVTKWIGAYKEAYGRKRSGMSSKDIEKDAQLLYGKTKFTNQEVFEQVMRHHPKWELKLDGGLSRKHPDDIDVEESHGSSKKSRTDEEGSNPTESTPISHSPTLSRPSGRDKAKRKGKGKATTSQSSCIPEEFTTAVRGMTITREKEIITREKEIDTMARKMDIITFNSLMNKSNLTPREEALKIRLMEELYPGS